MVKVKRRMAGEKVEAAIMEVLEQETMVVGTIGTIGAQERKRRARRRRKGKGKSRKKRQNRRRPERARMIHWLGPTRRATIGVDLPPRQRKTKSKRERYVVAEHFAAELMFAD